MCIVKFRTMVFFEDVICTSSPMQSENVCAFIAGIKQAGFDIIGVYPVDDEDYECEEIVVEDIDFDED